ncbi:flavoprotein [Solwaraspora sp. WMMA2080]|uniref:flavoprotein n=1 Tax=unclassified Solwaraspora TaxID=2627926 RepID=UPI00248AADCA|nr:MULTISPECIES: flavoprotein [unclassified Solwaraspora]WBB98668.1 flavoprotein [Solwaraspora sp. WMMA2059]WBC22780.1 flavoprotein [Solwaraspora sp. WMMA2080]
MTGTGKPTLYLVSSAAPPIHNIDECVALLQADGWSVCLIVTPTAATWIDTDRLASQTGFPVASRLRAPDEPGTLPRADAVVVAPASFNTINKWASGISDNLALGVLNEALGTGLPIVVSPYAKPALTQHPAYRASVRTLSHLGVQFTEDEALKPTLGSDRFRWGVVAEAFRATD